jgi:hypothetical protein
MLLLDRSLLLLSALSMVAFVRRQVMLHRVAGGRKPEPSAAVVDSQSQRAADIRAT